MLRLIMGIAIMGQTPDTISSLTGDWHLIEIHARFGKREPHYQQLLAKSSITVSVDKVGTLTMSDGGGVDKAVKRSIKMRSEQMPRELDLMEDTGGDQRVIKCIYSLNKQQLTVCFHVGIERFTFQPILINNGPRPSNFDLSGDVPIVTLIFEKEDPRAFVDSNDTCTPCPKRNRLRFKRLLHR